MGWRKTTLTILNGATESDVLDLTERSARPKADIFFFAPATLPETVTVQVAPDPGGTFIPLQSGGSNYTLPAAKATYITFVCGAVKLVAGGPVGGDRVFTIRGAAVA